MINAYSDYSKLIDKISNGCTKKIPPQSNNLGQHRQDGVVQGMMTVESQQI